MRTLIIAAAIGLLSAAASARADVDLRRSGYDVGRQKTLHGEAEPAVGGIDPLPVDFRPRTASDMATGVRGGKPRLQAKVDYDGDGVPDMATMVQNKDQIGVMVERGSGRGSLLVYRAHGSWGRAEMVAAGRRRLLIGGDGLPSLVLSGESGETLAYRMEN